MNELSEIIQSTKRHHIWFSDGDNLPWWVSDLDGIELYSSDNMTECIEFIKEEEENKK